jgi:hypothetical protein
MLSDCRQSPLVHSVHFYEHDSELIDRLRGIVISSLATGNAVLIVASEEHRRQLTHSLHLNWTNWAAARDQGRFLLVDARETLSRFMVNGHPDRNRFTDSVSALVRDCRYTALSANRGLTVFGEMVAILWEEGNKEGAIELEALWNELLSDRTFHLHCAYPKQSVLKEPDAPALRSICDHHSDVVGAWLTTSGAA